jgi:alkyl hydroperoxide reductase subunit AhpC
VQFANIEPMNHVDPIVFVIDDDASFRRSTERLIQSMGFQVKTFPAAAEFLARQYGVYRDGDGVTERALFVIDANGTVHWSYVSPLGINPGAAGILSALEGLQSKKEAK